MPAGRVHIDVLRGVRSRALGRRVALGGAGIGVALLVTAAALLIVFWPDSAERVAAPAVAVDGGSGPDRWSVIQVDPRRAYLPTLANAELAVGPTRLSFTVQDRRGAIVDDVDVQVGLYDLGRDRDRPVSRHTARFIPYRDAPYPEAHVHAGGASSSDDTLNVGAGVYVVPVEFDRAGEWGLEFSFRPLSADAESEPTTVLFRFSVRAEPLALALGASAPPSRTRTLADEPDIGRLTSDPRPEPGLYQMSIAEALATGKPLIVAFTTPAYCHSRTCGPTLDTVKAVWREWAGTVNAIHVEVFENPHEPEALRESAAFREWELPSEPWVFVIDGEGRVAARFEGTVTDAELRAAVAAVVRE